MRVYVIDGSAFDDLDGFYREAERLFTEDADEPVGHNLDAFNDLLRGGFGAHTVGEPIRIVWSHFPKSRRDLGDKTFLTILSIILDRDESGHDCVLELYRGAYDHLEQSGAESRQSIALGAEQSDGPNKTDTLIEAAGSATGQTDLAALRERIDAVDGEIVRLFEERMALAEAVARDKIASGKAVLDPVREQAKLDAISGMVTGDFNRTAIREVFSQLMSISRKRQYQILMEAGRRDMPDFRLCERFDFAGKHVIYQGIEGAYSAEAMHAFFGDAPIEVDHVGTWREAMDLVRAGSADYAVLPIENSTAGSVSDIYDLMMGASLHIIGEQIISVDHRLLGLPGASLADITRVYSHPQALGQCAHFLARHPQMATEPMPNTALAAQKVALDADRCHAAIASAAAGEAYGLVPLTEEKISPGQNATRFIVVGSEALYRADAQKVSLCFELPHACGTLYRILSHFIFNGLNMTKIESRPIPERPFEYRFFVDFDGCLSEPAVQNALVGIRAETADMRLLGNY